MQQLSPRRFSARNLPALLRHTAKRLPTKCFIRELRPNSPNEPPDLLSFAEFEQAVASVSEFLDQLGFCTGDRILLVAENSSDYQILSLAAQTLRAEPCAVFSSLGSAALQDIAMRVRPRIVFVSSQGQWDKLQSVIPSLLASGLTARISVVPLAPDSGNLSSFLMSHAKRTPFERTRFDARVDAVSPSDPFLLLFTSGTAGKQKGVRLTQDAFVRSIEGGQVGTAMTEADDGLMFLPFGHVAGQCQFMLAVALGHSLILISRREDLARAFALGPTYAFAVPMVYEKLKERVDETLKVAPQPLRFVLTRALAAASVPKHAPISRLSERVLCTVARLTIGRKLRQTLGGRLRMVASGGAAASAGLSQFFETMGIPFLSIYGMSETSGLIGSQRMDQPRDNDCIGDMSPDLEISIESDGELCVKGPMMMRGYLEEADNQEAFDERGYFHTGDLVSVCETTSQLRLVGRKKSLILLSTGKKLSPEPIEAQLSALPYLQAAVLVGDGRPYVSAIVFVLPDDLAGVGKASESDQSDALISLLNAVTHELESLSGYERPKRLLVIPSPPADFPEFVTPTLKLKRTTIIAALSTELDALYSASEGPGFLHRPASS